jgi:hypothetical protein
MRFMMIIKGDKHSEAGELPSAKLLTAMGKYNEELVKAGVLLSGEGLHPTSRGFRIQNKGGHLTVKDGPFTESKEIIAGYWILQVKSREEAIEWAKRVPFEAGVTPANVNETAQVELRQVTELQDLPPEFFESGAVPCPAAQPEAHAGPPPVAKAGKKRFILMFKASPETEAGKPPTKEQVQNMNALTGELAAKGCMLGGEGLQPSSKGARIYFSQGKRTVIDGPFAETKELICGFCIVQVDSREEALEIAKKGVLANGDCDSEGRQIFGEEDFPAELMAQAPEVFEAERKMREALAH